MGNEKKRLTERRFDIILIERLKGADTSGCSADGSVLGSGPRGRGFKSRHSDHVACS